MLEPQLLLPKGEECMTMLAGVSLIEFCQPGNRGSKTSFFLFTGRWRSYYGIPPDISIKELQWCLGLHQWHVQASIAQLWLSQRPRGTCHFSFLLLTDINHTYGTFQISYTKPATPRRADERGLCQRALPKSFYVVSLEEFLVHDVWKCRLSCIWQGKCVSYQHASGSIHNAKKRVLFLYWQVSLNNPKKQKRREKNSSLNAAQILGWFFFFLFRCSSATLYNKTMTFS